MEWKKSHKIFFLLVICLSIIFIIILGNYGSYPIWRTNRIDQKNNNGSVDNSVQAEVLLIYVYSNTHSHAYGNIKYFIENAVRENDGVGYYFILQNVNNKIVNESEMPVLPTRNGHYIQHENRCYDFGSAGWFFETYTFGNPWYNQTIDPKKTINITQYKYFILMNSSVRGPFFPPYFLKFLSDEKENLGKSVYWYHIFTKYLNDNVKLTGPTISCIPAPHVQSYVLVIDFIGLTVMLKPSSHGASGPQGIFGCYPHKGDVSMKSEVASSTRMLESGYMIASLLTKYQKVNFTEPRNRPCNQQRNPYLDNNLDGTPLEPYEVVFVKYNDVGDVQVGKKRCQFYEKWIEDTQKLNRSSW